VVGEFEARNVFVYAMGQEPWLQYIMGLRYSPDSFQLAQVGAFLEHCASRGINAKQLYLKENLDFDRAGSDCDVAA
jgi:hypothetical protein